MAGHHHHHHHHHHGHHDHHHLHGADAESGHIKVAFFLNLAFTLVEIVGGILTNSVAILSDAIHDLGDSLSLGLAWYLQKKSQRSRTESYTYGYRRFSLMGAIITSMVLVVGSGIIIYEAVQRLWNPEPADAKGMILLAVLGVIVNGAAMIRLKKGESLNAKVVSLHLLEDVLGWVAVLIGAVVMNFYDVPILDPLLSLAIAAFVLFNVYKNIKRTLRVVLQGFPDTLVHSEVEEYFNSLPSVSSFHDLHVWSMDGIYHVLTVHLVLENDMTVSRTDELKSKVKKELSELGVEHVTVEMELLDSHCDQEDC